MKRKPQLVVTRYVEHGDNSLTHLWKWELKAANNKVMATMNGYKSAYKAKMGFWVVSSIARLTLDVVTVEGDRKSVVRV